MSLSRHFNDQDPLVRPLFWEVDLVSSSVVSYGARSGKKGPAAFVERRDSVAPHSNFDFHRSDVQATCSRYGFTIESLS